MENNKIKCIECRNLWIGLGLAMVVIFFVGVAIFYPDIYVQNAEKITVLVKYSSLVILLVFLGWASQNQLRKYCFGNANDKGSTEKLVNGILSVIGLAILILVGINFAPITIQEINLRLMVMQYEDDLLELDDIINAIKNMDCKAFLSGYSSYNDGYELDNIGYKDPRLKERFWECYRK